MVDWIEVGMVYVNFVLVDSFELLFGGIKCSGIVCELGYFVVDEFVNKKFICIG